MIITKKVNRLVLVGNGFDLAHILKTRYSDFFLWYLNKALSSECEHGNYNFENRRLKFNLKEHFIFEFIDDISLFRNNTKFIVSSDSPLISRLLSCNKDRWIDIEYCYYEELIKLYRQLEGHQDDYKEIVSKALEKLNADFDLIKESLIEYLSDIKINADVYNPDINDLISDFILSSYDQSIEVDRVLFVNFNYTNTLDIYLNFLNRNNTKTINIHGKISNKTNPIIFGYGDEMDYYYDKIERLNNNEFLRNIKSFNYLKTSNYQDLIRFIANIDFEVYIMGHSCGLSDRILLNRIFEHENCKKIEIFYYKKSETENDYFEKTQEISRHFKVSNKSRMREIIVPLKNSKPLCNP